MSLFIVKDTDFSHLPDTSAVGAGSVLVDGWIDAVGGVWSVLGGTLKGVGTGVGALSRDFLLRPSGENIIDGQISAYLPPNAFQGGGYFELVARSHGYFTYLSAQIFPGSFSVYITQADSVNYIEANGIFNYDPTHTYRVDLRGVGTSPVVWSLVVGDVTTDLTVGSSVWADSSRSLLLAGTMGLLVWNGTVRFSRLTTYAVVADVLLDGVLKLISGPEAVQLQYRVVAINQNLVIVQNILNSLLATPITLQIIHGPEVVTTEYRTKMMNENFKVIQDSINLILPSTTESNLVLPLVPGPEELGFRHASDIENANFLLIKTFLNSL